MDRTYYHLVARLLDLVGEWRQDQDDTPALPPPAANNGRPMSRPE